MRDLPEDDAATDPTEAGEFESGMPEPSLPLRKRPPLAPGLYVVATPIGNLEDITLRALRVLREADRVGCEDTRQTQKLLRHFDITTPMVSVHRHNEHARSEELLAGLQRGERIALVSDAGTPGIADPGAELVAKAIAADVPVFVVPGPSAVLAAVVGSGMAPPDSGAFHFHGFLPARPGERRTLLETLRDTATTPELAVFYEAPHRITDTLLDLESVFGAQQSICLARELTKMHEEFLRGSIAEVRARLHELDIIRGELVLLLPAGVPSDVPRPAMTLQDAIRDLMQRQKVSEMDAIKAVAKQRGLGKSEVYREWQRRRKE